MVPELTAALWAFVADGHCYGRDILAQALATVAGGGAIETLLRVSAVDLGEDQDSLQSAIVAAVAGDLGGAEEVAVGRRGSAGAVGRVAGRQRARVRARAHRRVSGPSGVESARRSGAERVEHGAEQGGAGWNRGWATCSGPAGTRW
ncbi:hypothetical protein GCM10007977_061630 [Dactylosporangium sucinum]|uniref:Uncharacterized protein n=1 Tax=Dactylosporangium sucinum TaxID=1424081 RepID=A0A917U1K9_9ACTN|nr:hypothetical protein GCM10007977_061630 [Dactylosporangium sucinum]